ncbi:trihelix transcription factor ASR3-like isoform X1 [Primulina tabacum]|uniref:trihelix transcription factor ASR3-like isoform X1 n=1 Tax=Primulina tabacum TaxID=48773 RepID=UPI003F5A2ED2
MTLEQLSLVPGPVDGGADGRQPSGDDGVKIPRLPRWTRQEILVLIQGKRVAENRVKRGRVSGFGLGSGQSEPKWASVASYCKRHGVNRGPVQCRKRWSNLAGDFKKIKEWESKAREGAESFWLMRNDLRRERKLPGLFDKEVYDILDGGGGEDDEAAELSLALAPAPALGEAAEGGDEAEPLFDSGRSALADEGLFSDFELSAREEDPARNPDQSKETVAEKHPLPRESPVRGITNEKQPASDAEVRSSQEGRKRKRIVSDGDEEATSVELQLIEALEKNGKLLGLQLEAHNSHLQLEREQRKEHMNGLITVLNKLADALGRIADKL